MPHFDPDNSECRIYTRRAGVLSAIGHDLALAVGRYEVDVEDSPLRVRARFDASSLRVLGAVHGGAVDADTLSARDRTQIERHIADDVLEAGRYPYVEFASTEVEPGASVYRIRGRLRLHGQERAIAFSAPSNGERAEAEVTIHQPDFGITPFRAFGGALRVHADVRVRLHLPRLALGSASPPTEV